MAKADTQADEDAISVDMANEALASAEKTEEWEDVKIGLGEEWDFDKKGPMTGYYLGVETIELKEESWQKRDDGTVKKTAEAHQFGLQSTGEVVFVWGSYEIDNAMTEIGTGDKVRIEFIGRDTFKEGKRQIKRYKIQRAVQK